MVELEMVREFERLWIFSTALAFDNCRHQLITRFRRRFVSFLLNYHVINLEDQFQLKIGANHDKCLGESP